MNIPILLTTMALATPPIPNGVETLDYPEVVELTILSATQAGSCTGTIVGPNVILTAAHCLTGHEPDQPLVIINSEGLPGSVYSVETKTHPLYEPRDKAFKDLEVILSSKNWNELAEKEKTIMMNYTKMNTDVSRVDLGLIKVDQKYAFKSYKKIKLRRNRTFIHSPVTLVGYGRNDLTYFIHDGSGTKRAGTNTVSADWNGLLFSTGLYRDAKYQLFGLWTEANGKNVGVGAGDSGGPMFDSKDQLIGVNVNIWRGRLSFEAFKVLLGTQGEKIYSEINSHDDLNLNSSVNLSHPENVRFLKQAKEQGFEIQYAE